MTPIDENFIPGIHRYCDRWCERCEFTARCSVFAAEQSYTDEELDPGSETFVRSLKNIFAEAKQMLIEKAEEMGIDPTPISDEEYTEIRRREHEFIDASDLGRMSREYGFNIRPILESKDEWFDTEAGEAGTFDDIFGVIYWYQFLIGAKAHFAMHGLLDLDGFEDDSLANDPQSNANGSAKLAIIAVERSILAWTYLLTLKNSEVIRPILRQLETIKFLLEEKFPKARDFVRPGFDEIELVM